MVYPPWESLASASPQPNLNFLAEDKSHNLRVDVVDPILIHSQICSQADTNMT